jgi:hypothetical protein
MRRLSASSVALATLLIVSLVATAQSTALAATTHTPQLDRLVSHYGAIATPLPYHQTTLLVTPAGVPVGGKWQRWVDEAKVPTISGNVVLTIAPCPTTGTGGDACTVTQITTSPTASSTTNAIWVPNGAPATERYMLYHELGNVFDYDVMTPDAQHAFMRIWGELPADFTWADIGAIWWAGRGTPGDYAGTADVIGEQFAEGYQLCAQYGTTWGEHDAYESDEVLGMFDYPARYSDDYDARRPYPEPLHAWAISSQRLTCELIGDVAKAETP